MKLYQAIAIALDARANCEARGSLEWYARWQARLDHIARNALPSGSGVDNGTAIDGDSTSAKIVLHTAFHHMNDSGMYAGWSDHSVPIRLAPTGSKS